MESPRLATAWLSLLLFSPNLAAQGRDLWSRTYDGPANGQDIGHRALMGPQGEVYFAGTSTTGTATAFDALIQKRDAYGQLVWQRLFDLGGGEHAGHLALDVANDALYVAGGSTNPPSASPWLLWKLDAQSGATLWQQSYTAPGQIGGVPRGLALDAQDGAVMAGFYYPGSTSESSVAVVRFDPSGAQSWEWTFHSGPQVFDDVTPPAADPAGGVVVGIHEGGSQQDSVRKLTAAGALQWTVTSPDALHHVHVDAQSNVYFRRAPSDQTGAVEKRDPAGNLLWTRSDVQIFGTAQFIYDLEIAPNGEALALGANTHVARLDPAGNLLWESGTPPSSILDLGFPRELELATNGDVAALSRCFLSGMGGLASVSVWDAAGVFQWGQSVRAHDTSAQFLPQLDLAAGPEGAVVILATSQEQGTVSQDVQVTALRRQTLKYCFGDGSSGPCPCNNESQPFHATGCVHVGGFGSRLEDAGVASLAGDTLRFFGTGLQGPFMLLQGASAAPAPFENGILCLGGTLLRLYSGVGGVVDLPPAGGAAVSVRSAEHGDFIAPGSKRGYQLYYRAPTPGPCGAGGNLSNGIELEWAP